MFTLYYAVPFALFVAGRGFMKVRHCDTLDAALSCVDTTQGYDWRIRSPGGVDYNVDILMGEDYAKAIIGSAV